MEAHTDTQLTRCDSSQSTLAECSTAEHEPVNTALNEDSVTDNLCLRSDKVHSSLVMNGGEMEPHEEQSPIHPSNFDQEPLDFDAKNMIEREHSHPRLQSNPVQVTISAVLDEVSPERGVVSSGGPASLVNDTEASLAVSLQKSPSSRARTVSLEPPPRDDREADSGDRSTSVGMLHTELDLVQIASPAGSIDVEKTQEDFDYACEDFLPSLPPSSSPPQIFSSSPYALSQSSVGDVDPLKTVLAVEGMHCASPRGDVHGDHVGSVSQNDACSDFKDLHGHETAKVTTALETDESCPQMGPTPYADGGLEHSEKRMADPDGLYDSQPIKRLRSDPNSLHSPPAPKRVTLASQHRQLKKLAAPFRPPLKLPLVTDGPAQTMNNKNVESTISTKAETNHDRIGSKGPTVSLEYKTSNTSRSLTQFKSPLVNKVLPADSRVIRLTPALQALERRLQLLKRAIKVKEDNEEEVLIRLAEKWIEAGREVAHDVWNATKDAGDLAGKTIFTHRSRGWESSDDRNMSWGWDNKSKETGEESCDRDPSEASCTARQQAPDEDDDIGCNTLGTMLRQLGIAPEILGWDDDKETFTD